MIFVGLDVSTYTGMAKLDNGEEVGKVVNFPKAKGFERLQSIAREVKRTLELWKPDLIVIEGYAFGNAHTLVTLVECGTIVRNVVYELGIPWMEVPPTLLKKWVTGSGAAKKDKMAACVKARWGFSSPSDDIVDAYALAKMGETLGIEGMAANKGVSHGSIRLP